MARATSDAGSHTAPRNDARPPWLWRPGTIQSVSHLQRRLAFALLLAGMLSAAWPCRAAEPPSGATRLHVAGGSGPPGPDPSSIHFDFGTIDPLAAAPLAHDFVLHNESKAPLMIERLQTSCGCTSVLLTGDAQQPPVALGAGESLALHVRMDAAHFRPGSADKFVWVYAAGASAPAAVIELTVQVPALAVFSPSAVEMGRLRAGSSRSLPVAVALDARLAALGQRLELISSVPAVRVTPEYRVLEAGPDDGARVTRLYTLTLGAHADLGRFDGSLTFLVRPTASVVGSPQSPTAPGDYSAAVSGLVAPLSGEIEGEIRAVPSALVFGVIAVGRSATRSVAITGVDERAMRGLTATSASPLLTARLARPTRSGGAAGSTSPTWLCSLEVTAGAALPVGTLETQVFVTTASGQRLAIPVVVSAAKP